MTLMKDTISYSEYLFLSALERRDPKFEYLFINGPQQQGALDLPQIFYMEMVIASAEDNYIVIEDHNLNLLIGRLRGEIAPNHPRPSEIHDFNWANPREALYNKLIGGAVNSRSYHLSWPVPPRSLARIVETGPYS